jgi:hypothetical protein
MTYSEQATLKSRAKRYSLFVVSTFITLLVTRNVMAQPTAEDIEIGRAVGNLVSSVLNYRAGDTPETADPKKTPSPGPVQGSCRAGQFEIRPGVCIGTRPPTLPGYPKDFEFEVCFPFGSGRVCVPGFFHCTTDKATGEKTCELQVTTPPLIPNVECEFKAHPDGGTALTCTYPDRNDPFKKVTLPGRILYPGDKKICVQDGDNQKKQDCYTPEDLAHIPFLPELLPKLPGYPTEVQPVPDAIPAGGGAGKISNW